MQERTTLTRKQLYDLVWQTPMVRLAQGYALSDRGLAKLCARHDIPTPPRGYWAQLEAGRVPPRPKLPPSRDLQPIHLPVGQPEEVVDELAGEIAEEKDPANRIVVAERLQAPCDIVASAKAALQDAKATSTGLLEQPNSGPPFRVSRAALPRALRIADALIKGLVGRGWEVVDQVTWVAHLGEAAISISIDEGLATEEREVAPDLKGSYSFHYNRHEAVRKPSGRLSIALLEEPRLWSSAMRRKWHDSETRPLEEHLNEVVIGMIKLAAAAQAEVDRRKVAAREAAERQRQLQLVLEEQRALRAALAEERARVEALRKQVDRWCESESIRRYVSRARERGRLPEMGLEGAAVEAWAEWALRQADRLDPLTPSPRSIIDDAERIEHMCDALQGRR